MKPARPHRRSGFTLVEVMVSLAIFALLAAAGAMVLGQTIDTRFSIRAATDRTAELQRLRSTLKADLAQTTWRRARAPTGRPMAQPIEGARTPGDPVLVLTRAGWRNPDGDPRPSLQRVEYRLVENRLERRVAPYVDGARGGPPQVLYRGVKDVQVTFLQRGSEAPAYLAASDRPLPDAVRIVMTLDGVGRLDQLFLVAGA